MTLFCDDVMEKGVCVFVHSIAQSYIAFVQIGIYIDVHHVVIITRSEGQ